MSAAPALASPDPEHFEFKQISSGTNRPGVALDLLTREIVLGVWHGRSAAQIAAAHDRSTAKVEKRIDALVDEGLLHRPPGGQLALRFPVMTLADTERLMPVSPGLVDATADLIESRLPQIRDRMAALAGFEHLGFEEISLLVLSDVLLDNWQINGVESDMLGTERTSRGGGNYYLALMEKADPGEEAFGIYGNHIAQVEGIYYGVYGDRRYSGPPSLTHISAELLARFGHDKGAEVADIRKRLIGSLKTLHADPTAAIDQGDAALLRHLGLIDGKTNILIPVFGETSYAALDAMAAEFRPALVALLNDYAPQLRRHYAASPYARSGVAFEEYYMWWYHLYYSRVTDRMVERGMITLPPMANTTYLMVPEANAAGE